MGNHQYRIEAMELKPKKPRDAGRRARSGRGGRAPPRTQRRATAARTAKSAVATGPTRRATATGRRTASPPISNAPRACDEAASARADAAPPRIPDTSGALARPCVAARASYSAPFNLQDLSMRHRAGTSCAPCSRCCCSARHSRPSGLASCRNAIRRSRRSRWRIRPLVRRPAPRALRHDPALCHAVLRAPHIVATPIPTTCRRTAADGSTRCACRRSAGQRSELTS